MAAPDQPDIPVPEPNHRDDNERQAEEVASADSALLPHHAELLTACGITATVAQLRGYRTAQRLAQLQRLGFGRNQGNVPALVIPVYGIDGNVRLYQIRPDEPRINRDGQLARYEVPRGARLTIDVPPACRHLILDATMRLLVCVGIRSADAAASRGMACIALLQIRGWKNSSADWDQIPMTNREVTIVIDSAGHATAETLQGAADLRSFLTGRGAVVRILVLPPGPDGQRRNLDDYLTAGHSADDIWSLQPVAVVDCPTPEITPEPPNRYRLTDQGLCLEVVDQEGNITLRQLTNFNATITAQLNVTDGAEEHTELEIEATVAGERRIRTIRADEFAEMKWPIPVFGPKAVIYPGTFAEEHTRAAIQLLSDSLVRRTIYTHLGWVLQGSQWWFLHAEGAIGASGAVTWDTGPDGRPVANYCQIQQIGESGPLGPGSSTETTLHVMGVRAPDPLQRFRLPVPPVGEALIAAVRSSLGLIDLAPDSLTLPLLAAVYRAPLGDANYSISLDGVTGQGKTTLAALFQQHFGAGLDYEHLPVGWESTANYLEALAFRAKDVLLIVDDLVMRGSRSDVDRVNREADRFLRGQANRTGRGRCNSNGTPRPVRASRCLPICTQEESPGGHSLNARVFRLAVCDLDILAPKRLEKLSEYQSKASQGVLAHAMSGYIAYLANDLSDVQAWHRERRQELIHAFQADGRHQRTAYNAADLAAAFNVFLNFAVEVGAITEEENHQFWDRLDDALGEQVDDQHRHLKSQDPIEQFLECLHAALAGHQCHIAGTLGGEPPTSPGCWGWREESVWLKKEHAPITPEGKPTEAAKSSTNNSGKDGDAEDQFEERVRWRSCGQRVGWLFMGKVYLLAEKALGEAQRVAHNMGHHLSLQWKSLGKLLAEKKLLAERDLSRGRYTKRFNAEGGRHNTLCLKEETLMRKEFYGAEFTEDDYDGPPPEDLMGGQDNDLIA